MLKPKAPLRTPPIPKEIALSPGCVERCPGCQHRQLTQRSSQALKLNWLFRALAPWSEQIAPMRAPEAERRRSYRGKTVLSAEFKEGGWRFGLQVGSKRDGTLEVIHIPKCPVHTELVRKILEYLTTHLPSDEWLALRYVVVQGSLLVLVLKRKKDHAIGLEKLNLSAHELKQIGVEGLLINYHGQAGNRVINQKQWELIWGQSRARVKIGDSAFLHGPSSFSQLINELYDEALGEVALFLNPSPQDVVLDLYSGIGVSLKRWLDLGAMALGVELQGESVDCSNLNTGGDHCLQGRVEDRIPQIEQFLSLFSRRSIKVFVNPPRLGMDPKLVRWIVAKDVLTHLAYLSCSAGSLSRDLKLLTEHFYSIEKIVPFDFFPQTHHVETLVLLSRNRV